MHLGLAESRQTLQVAATLSGAARASVQDEKLQILGFPPFHLEEISKAQRHGRGHLRAPMQHLGKIAGRLESNLGRDVAAGKLGIQRLVAVIHVLQEIAVVQIIEHAEITAQGASPPCSGKIRFIGVHRT